MVAYHYDHMAQDNLPLTPLFLTPVIVTSWFAKKLQAFLITVVTSVALWIATNEFSRSWLAEATIISMQFLTYNMVGFLVVHLREAHGRALVQARFDVLTGLKNNLGFNECASKELSRMKRYQRLLGALYLDVDNFKQVNDVHGHMAGDRALKTVADAMRASIRAVDVAARIGGDEFIVLLPETDYDGLKRVAARIRATLSSMSWGELSCSIGGLVFKDPPHNVDTLIHAADELMYEAKTHGKAQSAFAGADHKVEFALPSPRE